MAFLEKNMFFSPPQKEAILQKTCFFPRPAVAEKNVIYVFFFRGKKHYPLQGVKNPPAIAWVTGVGKDGLKHSPPCPFPLPVTRQEKR